MLPVVSRSALQEGERKQVLEALQVLAAVLEAVLRIEVIELLVAVHLVHRIVGIWIADDQLAACFCHPLDSIEHKTLGELAYVLRLVWSLLHLYLHRAFGHLWNLYVAGYRAPIWPAACRSEKGRPQVLLC